MRKLKSFVRRVKFAWQFFIIAYRNEYNENQIVLDVVNHFKDEAPIAAHMAMFWRWLSTCESAEMHFSDNNVTVKFHNIGG